MEKSLKKPLTDFAASLIKGVPKILAVFIILVDITHNTPLIVGVEK
jgi:hypothetical protein